MALIKTSNPALGENTFRNMAGTGYGRSAESTGVMTLNGTVNKTGILLVCVIATAAWTWHLFMQSRDFAAVAPMMFIGLIGGFILAMVTIFKKEWSPVTSPIYALLEGLALGGISAAIDLRYPGIAFQAVGLTFGTLFVLLLAYRSGLIQVTQKFRLGIIAATGGIMVFYLLEMAAGLLRHSLHGHQRLRPHRHRIQPLRRRHRRPKPGPRFRFHRERRQYGAPKYMEWYGAFGIIVTLVWLYLEILRLLSKLRGSRN